uniref:Tc1-like transposase DDE domain-containing protein n=1 Tax=Paramormyrops kingsleyae TaxID=1676925 RepID=A0A3B3SDJ7_9TELE
KKRRHLSLLTTQLSLHNDPKHTTQSMNLNPIENLWGNIKNAVSEAKPRNAKELCQKLVDSLQHRCAAVLKSSGYTTKY